MGVQVPGIQQLDTENQAGIRNYVPTINYSERVKYLKQAMDDYVRTNYRNLGSVYSRWKAHQATTSSTTQSKSPEANPMDISMDYTEGEESNCEIEASSCSTIVGGRDDGGDGSDDNYFECPHCDKKFNGRRQRTQHIIRHRPPIHKCSYCPREFFRLFEFKRHIQSHDPRREPAFECGLCNKKFLRQRHLDVHRETHAPRDRKHKCAYCGRQFYKRTQLLVHTYGYKCEEGRFCADMILRYRLRNSPSGEYNADDVDAALHAVLDPSDEKLVKYVLESLTKSNRIPYDDLNAQRKKKCLVKGR
jgi:hypothetical protein